MSGFSLIAIPASDPDNQYTIPFMSTITVIAVNKEKCKELGVEIKTWGMYSVQLYTYSFSPLSFFPHPENSAAKSTAAINSTLLLLFILEMLAKLTAGGSDQYDLVMASCYVVEAMAEQDLIQPIHKENLENLGSGLWIKSMNFSAFSTFWALAVITKLSMEI